MNLFTDQPNVGYFPVIKANSNDLTIAAQIASSRENDWLDEFLPPGSRASTAELEESARPRSRNRNRNALNVNNHSNSRPGTGSRPVSNASLSQKYGTTVTSLSREVAPPSITEFNESNRAYGPGHVNVGMGVVQLETHAQAQVEANFAHVAQMYPSSGASISSSSYLSENRSIAHNKAAAVRRYLSYIYNKFPCLKRTC